MWITILLLSSPLGIFLGFMLTSIVTRVHSMGWEWSFYIQASMMIPCCMAIFFANGKMFDIQEANKFRLKCVDKIEKLYIDEDKEKEVDEQKKRAAETKSLMENPVMQEFLELRSQISVRHPPVRHGTVNLGRFSNRGGSVKGGSIINGLTRQLQGKS